jgi:molecular chaperone GrpE
LKNIWNKRGGKVPDKESKINSDRDENVSEDERPADSQGAAREIGQADALSLKLMAELEDLRQTALRRQADFDNYRKRIEKERGEDSKRTTARTIEALIPIIDAFEHALAIHREPAYENYRKGFELIYKQLLDNVAKLGAERFDPIGKHFDPHEHQAMDRTETTDREDGTVLETFQPGYSFHGRILRPAGVRVAVHTGAASKNTAN